MRSIRSSMEERLEAGDKKRAYAHVSLHERVGAFCNVCLALMCVCVRYTDGSYPSRTSSISSTTIESRKFRIPSDLRRQPGYRPVSSKVGDHLRILLGVVVHIPFAFGANGHVLLFHSSGKAERGVKEVLCVRVHVCVCMSVCISVRRDFRARDHSTSRTNRMAPARFL